jgi:hypothetical protein
VDVDHLVPERLDDPLGQNPHVPGEDDQVGRVPGQLGVQPVEVLLQVGVRVPGERQPVPLGDRLEVRVVREDTNDVAVELATGEVLRELLQAVRLPAGQQRDPLGPPLAVQVDPDLHLDPLAEPEQPGDQLGQVDRHVLEVDEHVHQEEPADDVLLDVLDVDAPLRQVRRELRDDALLVLPEDADDRQDGAAGQGTLHGKARPAVRPARPTGERTGRATGGVV